MLLADGRNPSEQSITLTSPDELYPNLRPCRSDPLQMVPRNLHLKGLHANKNCWFQGYQIIYPKVTQQHEASLSCDLKVTA